MHEPLDPRLQDLLDQRLGPGADRATIDARIWDLFGQEWCVMATDLAGFSRGVADYGIIPFLQTMFESGRLLVPLVQRHRGRVLKVEGDSYLAIFPDAQGGLDAAIEMQRATRRYNEGKPREEHLLLGVGLGFGRVLRVADVEVYGNEVNSACILGETYAKGYDILVTESVREQLGDDFVFESFEHVPPGARATYRVVYPPEVVGSRQ